MSYFVQKLLFGYKDTHTSDRLFYTATKLVGKNHSPSSTAVSTSYKYSELATWLYKDVHLGGLYTAHFAE